MNPYSQIRSQSRTLRRWVRLLASTRAQWRQPLLYGPSAIAAKLVLQQQGKPYMRLGYAMRELLVSVAKAQELEHAAAAMWPSMRPSSNAPESPSVLARALTRVLGRSTLLRTVDALGQHSDIFDAALSFKETPVKSQVGDADDPVLQQYYRYCRYRDAQALAWLTRDRERLFGEDLGSGGDLPSRDGARLALLVRRYRTSCLMFSWQRLPNGQSTFDRYPDLFAVQGRIRAKADLADWAGSLLGRSTLPDLEQRNVLTILRRLGQALFETDYSTFVDALVALGGQDGPESMIGNTAPVNVLSSSRRGAYRATLIALSLGRSKRSRFGFPVIMDGVKNHLQQCGGLTKTVVVLADTWDSSEFMTKHFDDLASHYRQGVRFLFVLAGADAVGVNPLSINFERSP